MEELTAKTVEFIEYQKNFFLLMGTVGMFLSFFILFLSFVANIRANVWEIGILRSLGLTSLEIQIIYILEAVAIVLTAIINGTIIGVAIALIFIANFILFMEVPFEISFPHTQ